MALVSQHVIYRHSATPTCPAGNRPEWSLDEVSWDAAKQTAALRLDAARRADPSGLASDGAAKGHCPAVPTARRDGHRRRLPPPGRHGARALRHDPEVRPD
eukprot:16446079-Heterocapsa_arctica.AAC.1